MDPTLHPGSIQRATASASPRVPYLRDVLRWTAEATPARFALALALLVLVLTAPRLWLHELWRDEAWLWIVATTSTTLPDLFHELSRSGQGYLFPILGWLAARVSTSHLSLQFLNLAIVVAGVYVVARWAPLRRPECVLLVFGYYCSYEYAVLSRHYALGMTLMFIACAAARNRRAPIVLGLALGLLCQTTVYGFILALVAAVGIGLVRAETPRSAIVPPPAWKTWLAVLLSAAGAVAGLVQLMPEPGTAFAVGWRFRWDPALALETLQIPWRALFPLPQPGLNAWNSDVLGAFPGWRTLAGTASLAIAVVMLWPRRPALMLFAFGTAGLLAFAYIKYVGTMRHHGHLWLLLVMAIWLAGGIGDRARARSAREWLLLAVLGVHVVVNVYISSLDLRHPFSNGARTAEFIRANGYDRMPLLGYREPPAASVALDLGLPLFAPSRNRYATHTDWGPLQRDLSRPELRCAARALALRETADVMLVMNSPLPPLSEITFSGSITGAMVASENFFLYQLHFDALQATAAESGCDGQGRVR